MSIRQQRKRESAAKLLYQMSRSQAVRHQRAEHPELDPKLRLLRAWQAKRLRNTYADLLSDARYRPACEFFLSELYGDKDFAPRDHDIERAYPVLVRTLPAHALVTLTQALELHALTQELDTDLLRVLVEELELNEHLTEAMYAEAYRRCDNYSQRLLQIELIHGIGAELDAVVANPFIYAALKLARGPAHLAGFGELQEFLEWGFGAFRHMHGAQWFLDTIVGREKRILDNIYAAQPQPFAV